MNYLEWLEYSTYLSEISPNFRSFKTIWENFLVINKDGFDYNFYEIYEKLQVIKESIDIKLKKEINGNGEGISIMVSSKYCNIEIGQDLELFNIVNNKMVDISRKFTPQHL